MSTVAERPSGTEPLEGVQVDGHERARPVVHVKDVGRPAEVLAELQRPATEEREAHEVVGGVRARRVVEVAAPEERLVIEQVHRHVGAGQARLVDGGPRVAAAERDAEGRRVARRAARAE